MKSWSSIAAVLVIAGALAAGCAKNEAELMASAASLEKEGRLIDAILHIKNALQLAPDDARARYELGRLYNRAFDPVSAEKELRKALELGIESRAAALLELARALRAQAKYEDVIKDIVPDQSIDAPTLSALHALRGRAMHALGSFDEARESLATAQELDAANPDVKMLEAQIAAGSREYDNALTIVEDILDSNPKLFDAWSYRAELLRLLQRPDDALAAYGKILELYPSDITALVRRSTLFIGKADFAKAESDVNALQRHHAGNPFTSVQAGLLELARGRPREALDAARLALQKAPSLPAATLLTGLASFQLGQFEQAEASLKSYLASRPADELARRTLAETLLSLKQPAEALGVLQPVLTAAAPDPLSLVAAGNAYMAQGDKVLAGKLLDRAASMQPDNPTFQLQRAMSALADESPETGLADLRMALAKFKEATTADEALVVSLLAQQRYDEASAAVDAVVARDPKSPISANLRGLVMMARKDLAGARTAFESAIKSHPTFLPAVHNLVQIDLAGGQLDAARGRYESVLASDRANVAAMLALAELELGTGQTDAATKRLRDAIAAAPDAVTPRKRLLEIQLANADYGAAADTASEALELAPSDAPLIVLAANAFFHADRAMQAEHTIERLIAEYPKSPQVHVSVAKLKSALGKSTDAEKMLQRALTLDPKYAPAQTSLVSHLLAEGRGDDALAYVAELKEKQPKAPIGWLLEGEIYERKEKFADAVAAYDAALERQPVGSIAVKSYVARVRQGKEAAGFDALVAWAKRHPDDLVSHAEIGNILLAKGESLQAIAYYEAVLQTGQATPDVLNALANAYHSLGDERAQHIAETALSVAPSSGYITDTLGWILFEKGQTERAIRLLKRAAVLEPNAPEIRYHLALAMMKMGDKTSAKRELEDAVKSKEWFPSRKDAEKVLTTL